VSDTDSQNKDEELVVETNADEAEVSADEATIEPVAPPPPAPKETTKSSSGIGWLALLLVLAMAGGAAWLYPQLQSTEAALQERLAALEGSGGQDDTSLSALESSLRSQMQTGLDQVQQSVGQLQQSVAQLQQSQKSNSSSLAQSLVSMESQLAEQRAELARFGSNDRGSWLMAEAEYLLRLANQRLIMAGDAVAAKALLESADKVLRELDDVSLHTVRGAVAADLAALRAVPKVDTEGIYLRLSALIEQSERLVIFEMPEKEARLAPEMAEDWKDTLEQGYQSALAKLRDYVVVRRRDVPMQALMDPQWEGMVRQNLRMLLEQSQVALLSGNGKLYRESLERAQQWVEQFNESDTEAANALIQELRQLGNRDIAVELPDISRSLKALDKAIEQRLQQGGGE